METTFDITAHVLLSAAAAALGADALAAHTHVAENVLGLSGAVFTGTGAEISRQTAEAKCALALQVSYQVDELPDRAWGDLRRDDKMEWFERASTLPVHAGALAIAGRLVGTGRKAPAAAVSVPADRVLTDEEKAALPFAFEIF